MMKYSFFETIRVENKTAFHLAYHQKRYESVLHSFGVSDFQNLQDFIDPLDGQLYRCKLIYTLDGVQQISYYPYTKRNIDSLQLIYDDEINYTCKYTDRSNLENLFEKRKNCDDVLIIKNGLVTDTSIANIAFYDGERWLTPKVPLLRGTTRQRLLDEKKIIEADINVEDLKSFTQVALLNAMIDFDIITDISFEY